MVTMKRYGAFMRKATAAFAVALMTCLTAGAETEFPVGAPYLVVDLSGGTDATSYPVSGLSAAPASGWTDEYKTTKLVLRRIEAGSFIMDDDQTNESHRVTISKPFCVGVFEVTQKQWELVMGSNPADRKGDMRPVENVLYKDIRGSSAGAKWPASSEVDATSFLGRLRAKTGLDGFDLPTEAQWEYACRAGKTSKYNNGGDTEDDLKTLGRYSGNMSDERGGYTGAHTTVGSYAPNAWGLYDMHGNVWEWCRDWYGTLSYGANPVGSSSGQWRIFRGGSSASPAYRCASSKRDYGSPSYIDTSSGDYNNNNKGFRLAYSMSIDESVSVTVANGIYDGLPHGVSVEVDDGVAGVSVKYASAEAGPYSATPPTLTDAGTLTVWYEVAAPGYLTLTNSATVSISKRSVTLTSGTAAKAYDGSPLVDGSVTVSGDGFVDGEGATFSVTGSQTAIGMGENAFTYTLNEGTKASNYDITPVFGCLTVAEVEAIKFAKTAVSVKESAAYAELTVNRTAKSGCVRVRYATADGTADKDARAGADYVETSGVLEWADGDRKAKKIRVPLIPDLVAAYDGVPSKAFTVRLSAVSVDELHDSEHLPTFAAGDVCTVTVKETSKEGVTPEFVYKKQMPKKATVKQDEDVPLSSGTFYGLLAEDGDALTNGLPKVASVTFTASTAATPALSAKVAIAGKTYSFSAKGFGEMSAGGEVWRTNTLVNVQKSGKVAYTNTLAVYVRDGKTTDEGAWLTAMAWVDLTMNVPDAKGKGVQKDICYFGSLERQNDRIQAYLDAAVDFAGYYTVSLTPNVTIGNGYLTLTVDSKGGAKVAGMLADGATKPSASPKACVIVADETSVNGHAMYVPVHFVKGTACLAGYLCLKAVNEVTPVGSGSRIVVDSSYMFRWYDDSATGCVALYGDYGCISLTPCGGWYDKVINLQRHYLDCALSVRTADIEAFPMGELPEGYDYVAGISPNGFALALENDKVVYDKRKIVKTNRLTDFDLSVNPCNVSVKLARATGLVTGGFSLWGASEDGLKQKEVTGFKTYGVLLLAREPDAPIGGSVVAPGFATKKVKTTILDEKSKKKTVTWPFSVPFDVVGSW